jgi:hypothetical protein
MDPSIAVRPATAEDRPAILELGPRLAEGVAAWRDQAEALVAGGRWLADSLTAALAGDGTVLVAVAADAVAGVISVRPRRRGPSSRGWSTSRSIPARPTPRRAFYAALGFAEEEVRLTRPVTREPVTPSGSGVATVRSD